MSILKLKFESSNISYNFIIMTFINIIFITKLVYYIIKYSVLLKSDFYICLRKYLHIPFWSEYLCIVIPIGFSLKERLVNSSIFFKNYKILLLRIFVGVVASTLFKIPVHYSIWCWLAYQHQTAVVRDQNGISYLTSKASSDRGLRI